MSCASERGGPEGRDRTSRPVGQVLPLLKKDHIAKAVWSFFLPRDWQDVQKAFRLSAGQKGVIHPFAMKRRSVREYLERRGTGPAFLPTGLWRQSGVKLPPRLRCLAGLTSKCGSQVLPLLNIKSLHSKEVAKSYRKEDVFIKSTVTKR